MAPRLAGRRRLMALRQAQRDMELGGARAPARGERLAGRGFVALRRAQRDMELGGARAPARTERLAGRHFVALRRAQRDLEPGGARAPARTERLAGRPSWRCDEGNARWSPVARGRRHVPKGFAGRPSWRFDEHNAIRDMEPGGARAPARAERLAGRPSWRYDECTTEQNGRCDERTAAQNGRAQPTRRRSAAHRIASHRIVGPANAALRVGSSCPRMCCASGGRARERCAGRRVVPANAELRVGSSGPRTLRCASVVGPANAVLHVHGRRPRTLCCTSMVVARRAERAFRARSRESGGGRSSRSSALSSTRRGCSNAMGAPPAPTTQCAGGRRSPLSIAKSPGAHAGGGSFFLRFSLHARLVGARGAEKQHGCEAGVTVKCAAISNAWDRSRSCSENRPIAPILPRGNYRPQTLVQAFRSGPQFFTAGNT